MGQIIAFPAQSSFYPDRAADLEAADCALLLAIRWWVEDYRRGEDPVPRLREGLTSAGAEAAALSVDGLMRAVARTGRQPVAVHCPRCPALSDDEKTLLHAASLAQAGDGPLAEKALRVALLSAEGAAFAAGALEGLGDLFAKARLFLSRRAPLEREDDDPEEIWSQPPSLH